MGFNAQRVIQTTLKQAFTAKLNCPSALGGLRHSWGAGGYVMEEKLLHKANHAFTAFPFFSSLGRDHILDKALVTVFLGLH